MWQDQRSRCWPRCRAPDGSTPEERNPIPDERPQAIANVLPRILGRPEHRFAALHPLFFSACRHARPPRALTVPQHHATGAREAPIGLTPRPADDVTGGRGLLGLVERPCNSSKGLLRRQVEDIALAEPQQSVRCSLSAPPDRKSAPPRRQLDQLCHTSTPPRNLPRSAANCSSLNPSAARASAMTAAANFVICRPSLMPEEKISR